jgi:uncharacterized protein with von Willebrand factor type A (vWA) domain
MAFFLDLRRAGLVLDVEAFSLLIRALQQGFGIGDPARLRALCRTLWARTEEQRLLLDRRFDDLLREIEALEKARGLERHPGKGQPPAPPSSSEAAPVLAEAVEETTRRAQEQLIIAITAPEEIEGFTGIQVTLNPRDYQPVSRRQMKQSLRYLRQRVREGPREELDLDATLAKVDREGVFTEPVLVPRRVNVAELLLLVDREGSMVPFHALAQRLVETAIRGGRFRRATAYYFHNVPRDSLYRDPARLEAWPVGEVLAEQDPRRVHGLIVSDAGAARGSLSRERLQAWERFLQRLRQRLPRIAWLNPVPPERWPGTTAEVLARRIPMFELSRRGLDRAVTSLRARGRGTPGWH